MARNSSETESLSWGTAEWSIVAVLVVLTAIVFAQLATHEFLNYDDPQFIFFNQAIKDGDVHWALTSTQLTWLPLTWLSYMLDFRLFGMHAAAFLLVNALLHALAACFLFAAMRQMTGETWPSAFVAALFAIHPAHVESVAWISERKDVLSTLFAIVALLFYAQRKLPLAAVAMVLSLMAKQTYVTLPFVFLLLDYWPLERLRRASQLPKLLIEKIPFFALSIAGSIAAFAGQSSIRAVTSTSLMPVPLRISNAFVAYARYIGKMILPVRLAIFYPLRPVPTTLAIVAAVLFVAVTAAAWMLRKRVPAVLVGWLWFVGTLVPVIGIIQIGGQALADRYTYFSHIGLSIAIVWGVMALPLPQRGLAIAAAIVVAIFTAMAWRQASYWKNCDTLFSRAIAVTGDNAIAEYFVGQYLQLSDPPRALTHLQRAIDLGTGWADKSDNPQYEWFPQSHVAASTALIMEARSMPPGPARNAKLNESIAHAKAALAIAPHMPQAPDNVAIAERVLAAGTSIPAQQAQAAPSPSPAPAPARQAQTPAVKPEVAVQVSAHLEKGTALSQAGKFDEAVAQYRQALQLAPRVPETHIYLALGLLQAKRNDEAVAHLREAKSIDPTLSNEILTRALHMQPDPHNIDMFIAQFAR